MCGTHPTIRALIDYEEFCGIGPVTEDHARGIPEITAEELKQKIDRQENLQILDVREPQEYQINRIPGSVLIPLGDLPARVQELDDRRELIVHCKSGVRSARAVSFLRSAGFATAKNLRGGVIAWIDKVDPTQPKY